MRSKTTILGITAAIVAAGASTFFTALPAAAEWPEKPITMYIGFRAGGGTDTLGRMLAKSLEQSLGQPIVVQNKAGGGGSLMATLLSRAKPDGYTIGMNISQTYSANPQLSRAAKYTTDDFTHIASIAWGQCGFFTNVDRPYKTFKDLIDAGKAGKSISYASLSPTTKALMDYIAAIEGIKVKVVSVRGGAGVNQEVLGDHVDVGYAGGAFLKYIAAGKLRLLAAGNPERLHAVPDVPTLLELGYGISSCSFFLLSGPKNMPEAVLDKLVPAVQKGIKSQDMTRLLKNLDLPPYIQGPKEVTNYLKHDAQDWTKVIAKLEETKKKMRGK